MEAFEKAKSAKKEMEAALMMQRREILSKK